VRLLGLLVVLLQFWHGAGNSNWRQPSARIPLLTFGDSKTEHNRYQLFLEQITEFGSHPVTTDYLAHGGYSTATWYPDIDTELAAYDGTEGYTDILVNLGAGDVVSLPVEATWKTQFGYILDALHAKWPQARVFVMRVWRQGLDANCDTYAGWIDDILASRSWAQVGPDERVFLKQEDDGASRCPDGVHPNSLGYWWTAEEWRSILGY
jgi:lysophospholipase L1-like esterase